VRRIVAFLLLAFSAPTCVGQNHAVGTDEFDFIYDEAKSTRPEAPITESFFDVAKQRALFGLGEFQNVGHIANYLADHFSLYSRVQSEVIRPFCSSQGVEIQPFLDALSSVSSDEAMASTKIYERLGIDYEQVWAQLKPGAVTMTDTLVQEAETTVGVSSGQLCSYLGGSPAEAASALSYSRMHPSRSEILRVIINQ
jgi:hypothetical protein